MTEPDRGESYLEIQMDRSTIVLAALGLLACMVVAFLLGSWTATRKASADQAAQGMTATPADAAADPEDDVAGQDVDVDAEPSFGGRPVSASGAPPLRAVPPPPSTSTSTPTSSPTTPAGTSRPKGSSGITVASDGDDGKAEDASASRASTAKPTTKPTVQPTTRPTTRPTTKAPARTSAPAKPAAASSDTPSSGAGWVVQVAAVKERAEAEALQKRLQGKGYPVRLFQEGGFLKVQVGPFAQKSDAQAAEQRLKSERGLATWVKKA